MGISIERVGFVSLDTLANSLMSDLIANGFTLVYPSSGFADTVINATLDATVAVDPLCDPTLVDIHQPWRIKISVEGDNLRIFSATSVQLNDEGGYVSFNDTWNSGEMSKNAANRYFFNRVFDGDPEAHTLAYRLTVTPRGLAFIMWQEHSDKYGNRFSWFVIQRLVNHNTGLPLITGRSPLVCLYSVEGQESSSYQFVVREHDINSPELIRAIGQNSEDSSGIINFNQQVSITEGNNYVITFPNGFNTQRYTYMEEIDLIAYTSADVISQQSDVSINVYGEPTDRTYKACHANGEYNTNMRILMLTENGGV